MSYTAILRRPDRVGDDYKTTIQHVEVDLADVCSHEVSDLVLQMAQQQAQQQAAADDQEARPHAGLEPEDYSLVVIFAGHHAAIAVGD